MSTLSLKLRKLLLSKRILELGFDIHEEYIESIIQNYISVKNRLAKSFNSSNPNWTDFHMEENYINDQLLILSTELGVISLYKLFETKLKTLLAEVFHIPITINISKIKIIKKSFLDNGINLELIPFYRYFNEIRCLNNCIKHSGKVDSELFNCLKLYGKAGTKIKVNIKRLLLIENKARSFLKKVVYLCMPYI